MPLSIRPSGVWPATVTPFDEDGAIATAALKTHVAEVAAVPGVTAVVVNGHAGETTSLDHAERMRVVAAAAEAAGPVPVVAGIVTEDPREAAILAREAVDAGAAALLVFPPALFARSIGARPEMARRHLGTIAQATDATLVHFQLSAAGGLAYGPELIARLFDEIPALAAVKDGSDSPESYEDTLKALRGLSRPAALLTSNNGWLMASLAIGGDGILSGLGSVAAPLLAALHDAMQAGRLASAREIQSRLRPLCRAFYRTPSCDTHNRMKTALHLLGRLPGASPRPPLLPLDPAEVERIRQALLSAGLLG